MTDGLISGGGIIVCAAILYGCDFATYSFLANPDPARKVSVRLLALISVLAIIGFYGAAMLFTTNAFVHLYTAFGHLAGRT